MTKKILQEKLRVVQNNFILVYAASRLFCEPRVLNILETLGEGSLGRHNMRFNEIAIFLKCDISKREKNNEFVKMGIRMMLKEPFELIKDYCKLTNQSSLFKKQKWYHFARLLRNCVSHNFRFKFLNYDERLLPISYKGKTIDISKDNTELHLSFFGQSDIWELFCEISSFVDDVLN